MKASNTAGKPNLPLMRRWIKALESGKYKQAQGRLKRTHGTQQSFCCLGVLRDLEPKVFEGETRIQNQLPEEGVAKFCGSKFRQDHYAGMNDDGYSFKEIAAKLRQQFKIK